MTKNDLIEQRKAYDENNSNHHVANTMIGVEVFYLFSWLLNELGIFYVDDGLMRLSVAASIIFLIAPAVLVKTHKFDFQPFVKYVLLGGILVSTFVIVTLMPFFTVMLLVFPLVVATFYHSKTYSLIAVIGGVLIALLSALLAYVFKTYDTNYLLWVLYSIDPSLCKGIPDDVMELILGIDIPPAFGMVFFFGMPHALFVLSYSFITGSVNRKRIVDQIEWVDELSKMENEKDKAMEVAGVKTNFLATMSHEIRTPINAILGMNTAIIRESKEEVVQGYAADVDNAGKLLLSLVNDILDYSKLDADKMELTSAPYGIKDIVTNCYNLVVNRAKAKNLGFSVNIDPMTPTAFVGDEVRVQQIITNILTNAVKYTAEGGVELKVWFVEPDDSSKGGLAFSIKDTGIGIREEDIDKLFTAFDRLESKKNTHIEGTGLGLSITNKLVKLMGGEIKVESEYGRGSTFTVIIPQMLSDLTPVGDVNFEEERNNIKAEVEKDLFVAPTAKILVVDDVPLNIKVAKTLLRKTAVRIDTAESGEECIGKITENYYDVILLDHQMPGMDGIETLHKMQNMGNHPNINTPVVALTANYSAGARSMYMSEGFSEYLAKPFTITSLQSMLLKFIPEGKIAKRM